LMNSCISFSYCVMGSITSALLLSDFAIMASLRLSFVFMEFVVLASACVRYVLWWWFLCSRLSAFCC
jgi:hypothetical protein